MSQICRQELQFQRLMIIKKATQMWSNYINIKWAWGGPSSGTLPHRWCTPLEGCDVLFGQHLFHRLQFGPEHSGHEICLVLQGLAWKQRVLYLVPVWVAGHHQEDVRLAIRRRRFCDVVHVCLLGSLMGAIYINKDTHIRSLHVVISSPHIFWRQA